MNNTIIGYVADYANYDLKCTNKICDHTDVGTHHFNGYHPTSPSYGEKIVCPKCGFKTLEICILGWGRINDAMLENFKNLSNR